MSKKGPASHDITKFFSKVPANAVSPVKIFDSGVPDPTASSSSSSAQHNSSTSTPGTVAIAVVVKRPLSPCPAVEPEAHKPSTSLVPPQTPTREATSTSGAVSVVALPPVQRLEADETSTAEQSELSLSVVLPPEKKTRVSKNQKEAAASAAVGVVGTTAVAPSAPQGVSGAAASVAADTEPPLKKKRVSKKQKDAAAAAGSVTASELDPVVGCSGPVATTFATSASCPSAAAFDLTKCGTGCYSAIDLPVNYVDLSVAGTGGSDIAVVDLTAAIAASAGMTGASTSSKPNSAPADSIVPAAKKKRVSKKQKEFAITSESGAAAGAGAGAVAKTTIDVAAPPTLVIPGAAVTTALGGTASAPERQHERVSSTLNIADLVIECRARGIAPSKDGSHTQKQALLAVLGEGSIVLHRTSAFKEVEAIKALMAEEVRSLFERVYCHAVSSHPHTVALTADLVVKGMPRVQSALCRLCCNRGNCKYSCEKCNWDMCARCIAVEEKKVQRTQERAGQLALHHFRTGSHACAVAETVKLKLQGQERLPTAVCDGCHDRGTCRYSCERCDWDMCAGCITTEEQVQRRKEELTHQQSAHRHKLTVHKHFVAATGGLVLHGLPRAPRASCNRCKSLQCSWTCEQCDWDICAACVPIRESEIAVENAAREREIAAEATRVTAHANKMAIQRDREIASQKHLHTVTCAMHVHKVARTEELNYHGASLTDTCSWSTCSLCNKGDALFTCDQCEWSICEDCDEDFSGVTLAVRKPSAVAKDVSKMKKFVVWSSDGYGYDGWHSYAGPPAKEYDSSWDSTELANARVIYLFYAENSYGLSIGELMQEEVDIYRPSCGPAGASKFARYCVTPDDSTTWTVEATTREEFRKEKEQNSYRDYDYYH